MLFQLLLDASNIHFNLLSDKSDGGGSAVALVVTARDLHPSLKFSYHLRCLPRACRLHAT